jgi:hypothetical protein
VSDFSSKARALIFDKCVELGVAEKTAKEIARFAVLAAGPGESKSNVNYRVVPGEKTINNVEEAGYYIVEVTEKDSYTEPVEKSEFVTAKRVRNAWRLICDNFPHDRAARKHSNPEDVLEEARFGLSDYIKALIRKGVLPVDFEVRSFNGGGRNRDKLYFPLYLHPLRALDFLERIRFGRCSWRLQ